MSESLKSLNREQQIKLRQYNIVSSQDLADVLTDELSRPRIQTLLDLDSTEMTNLVAELEDLGMTLR